MWISKRQAQIWNKNLKIDLSEPEGREAWETENRSLNWARLGKLRTAVWAGLLPKGYDEELLCLFIHSPICLLFIYCLVLGTWGKSYFTRSFKLFFPPLYRNFQLYNAICYKHRDWYGGLGRTERYKSKGNFLVTFPHLLLTSQEKQHHLEEEVRVPEF